MYYIKHKPNAGEITTTNFHYCAFLPRKSGGKTCSLVVHGRGSVYTICISSFGFLCSNTMTISLLYMQKGNFPQSSCPCHILHNWVNIMWAGLLNVSSQYSSGIVKWKNSQTSEISAVSELRQNKTLVLAQSGAKLEEWPVSNRKMCRSLEPEEFLK